MIDQWSLSKNRTHDPLLLHIEFRGFTSNELICADESRAPGAIENVQQLLESYWKENILTPLDVRCGMFADQSSEFVCKDTVMEALEAWGWPTIMEMRARKKLFVFNLNLYPSNEICRNVYYNTDRYKEESELFFDRAFQDQIGNARTSRTSAFAEGFDQWMQTRHTGLITRLRHTYNVERATTLGARFDAFPITVMDFDKSPKSTALDQIDSTG